MFWPCSSSKYLARALAFWMSSLLMLPPAISCRVLTASAAALETSLAAPLTVTVRRPASE